MTKRKREHIELAFRSQTTAVEVDPRFIYEPLLSGHPTGLVAKTFLGRTFRTPIWACSMTGGTHFAKRINEKIARICRDFGMGMGKQSLERLLQLPLQAVEFGAFGGTNFSKVELQRRDKRDFDIYTPLTYVGQTAEQMVDAINDLSDLVELKCKHLIISGGIHNFLDGYYLMKKSTLPAVYGQASAILKFAKQSYEDLFTYIEMQSKGLALAEAFLRINTDNQCLSALDRAFVRAEMDAQCQTCGSN